MPNLDNSRQAREKVQQLYIFTDVLYGWTQLEMAFLHFCSLSTISNSHLCMPAVADALVISCVPM